MKEIYRALRAALRRLAVLRYVTLNFPTVSVDHNVEFKGDMANLHLGSRVSIQSNTSIDLGGSEWCGKAGHLSVGDDSVISQGCVIYAAGPGGVRIGKRFDCGPGVGIFSSRTDYEVGKDHHKFGPVNIGDDVILFAHVVVGPGVTIGDGAVVAAGSVVTRDIPENAFAGGVPARILIRDVHAAAGRDNEEWTSE
jgi:acetyltransferase-like isoleucine patch superfamily enzyme